MQCNLPTQAPAQDAPDGGDARHTAPRLVRKGGHGSSFVVLLLGCSCSEGADTTLPVLPSKGRSNPSEAPVA